MKSYNVKENYIGSAVTEIFWITQDKHKIVKKQLYKICSDYLNFKNIIFFFTWRERTVKINSILNHFSQIFATHQRQKYTHKYLWEE